MVDRVDVAVIGGGAAGIAAARRLACRPDLSVLVVEAKDRLGGRAHTLPGPLPVDLGCAWLHGALDNAWTGIAEAEGFTVDRRPAPWDREEFGEAVPDDSAAALDRFRRCAEEAAARGEDGPLSDLVPDGSRWRGLLDAISTYVSGAELDRVSVRDAGEYRPGDGDDWRVVEGYGRLVAHYGRGLHVALGTPVTSVDHSGAGPVRLETPRGVLEARVVVVTASTDVLANGGIRFRPALPDKVEAASLLPLGTVEKLWLRTLTPGLFPSEHYWPGADDDARTAAYHLRPFGRPVVECFFGGALAADLGRAGAEAMLDFARGEIRGRLGADAARALEPLCATGWAREPFIRGAYAYAVPGGAGARARLVAPVDERLIFAGEATHPSRFTTAHGAYESGVRAAEAALERFAAP